jgi:hypothetical protein
LRRLFAHLCTRLALGCGGSGHTNFLAFVELLAAWLNKRMDGDDGGEAFNSAMPLQ